MLLAVAGLECGRRPHLFAEPNTDHGRGAVGGAPVCLPRPGIQRGIPVDVSDSLFDVPAGPESSVGVPRGSANAPLAVRMRPMSLDEVVGQHHLLQPGSPLRRLVDGSGAASVILYGPPGTGKTTLASLISQATERRFEALSALSAGVKEVRAVIDGARRAAVYGEQTVLFIDDRQSKVAEHHIFLKDGVRPHQYVNGSFRQRIKFCAPLSALVTSGQDFDHHPGTFGQRLQSG